MSSLRNFSSVPFLMSSVPKDPLKLSLGSGMALDSSSLTPPPSATPGSSLSRDQPNPLETLEDRYSIERQGHLHGRAASVNEAPLTWVGQLPIKIYKDPVYSRKVFLGGIPWSVTETDLIITFDCFGPLSVEWPGKERQRHMPKGHVYLLFESETSVCGLLQACTQFPLHPGGFNNYYFTMGRSTRYKDVQVIPWVTSDSSYVRCPCHSLDPSNTVYVGALHGMLNAEALANIMNDLFGGVVYAGIDTHAQNKYPIGSGHVTFNNQLSYMKAVRAGFVEIKTPIFTKKVQIDPYVEVSMCQMCKRKAGSFFCRDLACFGYYCWTCWQCQHPMDTTSPHRPLMGNHKNWGSS